MESDERYQRALRVSLGLVDLMWQEPRPALSIDHSARDCIAARLVVRILDEVYSAPSEDDARRVLLQKAKTERLFRTDLATMNQQVIDEFAQHYREYGGAQALFAYCLLLSMAPEEPSAIATAKGCLANWYFEDRRISRILLDGGGVGAWWPFEWFAEHFKVIASTTLASGILFELAKHAVFEHVLHSMRDYLQSIRGAFQRLPGPVLRGKASDMTVEAFERTLEEAGLTDSFLFLFDLSPEYLERALQDWTEAFCRVRDSLTQAELRLLTRLLQGAVVLDPTVTDGAHLRLRESGLTQVIEPSPKRLEVILYPQVSITDDVDAS